MAVLKSLTVQTNFMLTEHASKWANSPQYQDARSKIRGLEVGNDCAERALVLMTTYNASLTTRESEMQKIIQIVEDHRKRVTNHDKKSLQTYQSR